MYYIWSHDVLHYYLSPIAAMCIFYYIFLNRQLYVWRLHVECLVTVTVYFCVSWSGLGLSYLKYILLYSVHLESVHWGQSGTDYICLWWKRKRKVYFLTLDMLGHKILVWVWAKIHIFRTHFRTGYLLKTVYLYKTLHCVECPWDNVHSTKFSHNFFITLYSCE